MKKALIAVVIAAFLGAGGVVGYRYYQNHNFVKAAMPYVKNSSLRLANGLRYETGSSAGITYRELFAKLEEDVAETEKNILQIQTIATRNQKDLVDPMLAYLQCAQEMQRSLVSKYRKQLAAQSALERAKEAVEDLKTSNEHNRNLYLTSSRKALEEAKKANAEGEEIMQTLSSAARKMKDLIAQIEKG